MFLRTWTGPCSPHFPVDKFQQKLRYLQKKKKTTRREKESVCFLKRYRAWETWLQSCQGSRSCATAASTVPPAPAPAPHQAPFARKGHVSSRPAACQARQLAATATHPARRRAGDSWHSKTRLRRQDGSTGQPCSPRRAGTGCCAPEGLQRLAALRSRELDALRMAAVNLPGVLAQACRLCGCSVGRAGCPSAQARQKGLSQPPRAQGLAVEHPCIHVRGS